MSAHHGDPKVKIRTSTDVEWLAFGAQVGRLVNDWARRSDIIAYVGPDAGQTGPKPTALFNPHTAEVEVNTTTAFGDKRSPSTIGDFMDLNVQREFPAATGAIFHEAAHARFTTFSLERASKTLKRDEMEALMLLEESRAEGLLARAYPKNVPFLRACALGIVLGDTLEALNKPAEDGAEPPSAVQVMGNLAGLALARLDIGVLKKKDVVKIKKLVETHLPADVLKELENLWQIFQSHDSITEEADEDALYTVAIEWARILRELAEERGEQMTEEQQQALADAISEAVGSDRISAEEGASGDIEQQETQERWDKEVEEKMKANREKDKNAMAGKETFDGKKGKAEEDTKVTGRGTTDYWGETRGRITDVRVPTAKERIAANQVAQALERAKYHDRIRTVSASSLPPGRLKTRSVVQADAYKSQGIKVPSEPWRAVKRKHTIDPNLTVGIMVDVSGSMSSAMKPMASIAWIMSEAVRRIQGRAAMVYYGNQVIPALYPGEHLEKVRVRSANDSTERFDLAFRSLDGALNLTHATGARLLVIVSDGHYTETEVAAAKLHMKTCAEKGVAVLWIGIEGGYGEDPAQKYIAKYPNAQHRFVTEDLSQYARIIGNAAEAALNKAGQE